MSKFWLNGNGFFVVEGAKAIRCDDCPCIYYLEDVKLVIENGNLGTPEIIEIDLVLGTTSSINLEVYYLGTEYGVTLEMLADGPSELCGTEIQNLTFDFRLLIDDPPEGEDDEPALVTTVPEDNVDCIEPNQISIIPYEGTWEQHTALVSACQCQCLDDFAFEGVFNIQTTGTPTPPPPEPVNTIIEVQDPVDPVDPDTTEIRFRIFYCYTRCPVVEEEE